MYWLDIVLAIPMAWFVYKGFRKGLIFELSSLIGLVVGIYCSIKFSKYVSTLIGIEGEYSILVAFFITFIAVYLLSLFLGKCIEGLMKMMKMGIMNNILGSLSVSHARSSSSVRSAVASMRLSTHERKRAISASGMPSFAIATACPS